MDAASVIVTLSQWLSGAYLCTGQPLTESDDTRCRINTIQPPDDEHIMLETCRGLLKKRIVKQNKRVSRWSLSKIKSLRTVWFVNRNNIMTRLGCLSYGLLRSVFLWRNFIFRISFMKLINCM